MSRDARQRDLVPPEKLSKCHAVVVGVGAVGRQVALQLTSVGVPRLTLIDSDSVEEVNLGPQGYFPPDVGLAKVDRTQVLCNVLNPECRVMTYQEKFKKSLATKYLGNLDEFRPCVFCCVDSISARKFIWELVRFQCDFWSDGRVAAECLRVLTSPDPPSDQYYSTSLFDASEAYAGSCTAKMTVFHANIAAGLMLQQWSRWLRKMPCDKDLILNLLSSELEVS